MQTPLEVLIKWVDDINNSVFALSSSAIELKMLRQFKTKCQSLLLAERQIIIDAHSHGIRFITGNTKIPQDVSEHYFNKTFTHENQIQ